MKGAPKPPKEDPEVKAIRQRQVADLAKTDEELNKRLKAMLRNSYSIRAFRSPSVAEAGSQVSGRTGRMFTGGSAGGGGAGSAAGGGYGAGTYRRQ